MAFGQSGGFTFGNNNANTSSLFGAKPATTGSIFGNASASNTSTSGIFGSTPATNTFGMSSTTTPTTSLFGNNATSGTNFFGGGSTTNTSFGFNTQPVPNGTFGFNFEPRMAPDSVNAKSGSSRQTHIKFMSIAVMQNIDERKNLAELRLDDYKNAKKEGVKGGYVKDPSVATPSLFGSTNTNTSGIFGNTNTTTNTSSLFGNNTQKTSIFGGTQQPTMFGSQTPASTSGFSMGGNTSMFGNQNKPSGFGTTGTSMFGQTTANTGTGLFGSSNSFGSKPGAFTLGQATPTNTGTGLFGNATTQPTTSLFGAAPAASTPFSFGNTTTQQKTGGFNFGNTTSTFGNTTQAKPGGFSFGQPATNTSNFSFGNTAIAQKPTGFNFGNTTATTGGLFNTPNTTLFGNTQQTTSLFGQQPQQNVAPGFNFGATAAAQQPQQSATTLLAGNLQPTLPPAIGLSAQKTYEIQDKAIQSFLDAPYGDSPLLRMPKEALEKLEKEHDAKITAPTDPNSQKLALKNASATSGTSLSQFYKLPKSKSLNFSSSNSSKLDKSGSIHNFTKLSPKKARRVNLFDDLEDRSSANVKSLSTDESNITAGETPFLLNSRSSAKALNVKLINTHQNESLLSRTINESSHLSRTSVSPTPEMSNMPISFNEPLQSSSNETHSHSNQSSSSGSRHESGITARRTDYKLTPSLAQILGEWNSETRTCIITNFTISRKGYGSITFNGETDLAGCDLDEIVHIRQKAVIVYPDDDTKPPLGKGLNRPATVALDGTYPKNKKRPGTLIQDPAVLEEMSWASKLEKTCAKIGCKFVDFLPDTGRWIFEVEHFSKYALDDSDDSDTEEYFEPIAQVKTMRKHPQQMEQPQVVAEKPIGLGGNMEVKHQPTIFSGLLNDLDDDDSEDSNDMGVEDGYVHIGSQDPRYTAMSLFKDEMTKQVPGMKATLFDTSDNEAHESDAIDYENSETNFKITKQPVESFEKLDWSETVGRPAVIIAKEEESMPVLKIPKPIVLQPQPKHLSSLIDRVRKFACFPVRHGPTRVSFSADGSFTSVNFNQSPTVVKIWKHTLPKASNPPDLPVIPIEQDLHMPVLRVVPRIEETVKDRDSKMFHHLVHALFGKLTFREEYFIEGAKQDLKLDNIRKRRLNQFFRKYLVRRNTSGEYHSHQQILKVLKLGKFQEAAKVAQKHNQPMLATCIVKMYLSSMNSIEVNAYKQHILDQVIQWRDQKTDQFINEHVLQCYTLLSGCVQFERSDGLLLDNISDCNWLELLATHFWFICDPEDEISTILQTVISLQKKIDLEKSLPDRKWDDTGHRKHPCYYLLSFFCDPEIISLNDVLDPLNFSKYSLHFEESWHAWKALAATEDLNQLLTDCTLTQDYIKSMSTRLHLGYSNILVKNGLFLEAIYVLQHLDNDEARLKESKSILLTNWSRFTEDKKKILENCLGVNRKILYEIEILHRKRVPNTVSNQLHHIKKEMELLVEADQLLYLQENYIIPYITKAFLSDNKVIYFKIVQQIVSKIPKKSRTLPVRLLASYLDLYMHMKKVVKLDVEAKLDGEHNQKIRYDSLKLQGYYDQTIQIIDQLPQTLQNGICGGSKDANQRAFLQNCMAVELVKYLSLLTNQIELDFDTSKWSDIYRHLDLKYQP